MYITIHTIAHRFLTQYAILVSQYFLERMKLKSDCPFLNLYSDRISFILTPSAVYRIHTTCTPISHGSIRLLCRNIFQERVRSVCPLMILYRQSHLSHPVVMSCVQNQHHLHTDFSHNIRSLYRNIFLKEDEIEFCLSFSEFI